VMSATVVPAATVVLDLPRRGLNAAELAADATVAASLGGVIAALLAASARADSIDAGG